EAIRLALKGFLHVTTTVLLLAGLGFAGHHLRAGMTSGETASATRVPRVADAVNGAVGAADALLRAALAALDMGKKEEKELWIPKEPAPWQKVAKDCNPDLGETPINGGCWVYIYDVKPPCKLLFRHGDKCYRPASADPTKPVGMFPSTQGQP
ncbi:MAG TPA: hypothetical protein VK447_08945, partial [Myxococcaceae bacterium]|nr:hypothetical protein [Myxococcaceae bacterium]